MTKYADLGDFEEDERIAMIGHQAMVHKKSVAFIVDDIPGKAERYIVKLQEKFPGIRIIGRGKGPVRNTQYVKVGPPVE